jgi:beta-galactosidase
MFRSAPLNLSAFALAALVASAPAYADRAQYDFNPGWKLLVGDPANAAQPAFDDAAWKAVTLPRAWNEDDAFAKDIVDHSTGIAWYRKRFKLASLKPGQKVFLEFEGARQAAEVFVNGRRIGLHENGVTAFGFDITAALVKGENLVAVRTDNRWDYKEQATGQRYQWADRNFNANYGGLPKNVRLHVTEPLYQTLPLYSNLGTTGVYVYARDFDIAARSATIAAESEVRNESKQPRRFSYEVELRDKDGKAVARFASPAQTLAPGATTVARASAKVNGLHFWSWGYGYLYDVVTTLMVDGKALDRVSTRTGFRKTEFAQGMVKLNDRVLQMKGYAQRTSNEWPAIGLSVPSWLSDYSNGLAVQSNANLIRWMHIAPWKQDVESLDRVGLMQAMPAGDSEKDVDGRRWGQRVETMRDAMVYFRNNPSILFYESGNKGVSAEHQKEMNALRDRFDPHGGRAAGSREMLSSELQQVSGYGGEMLYINKSARMPMWATEYSRDEASRRFWDEFSPPFHKDGDGPDHNGESAAIYNRNQDSHAIENVARWYDYWRERPGTGQRVNAGGVNIIFSDSNTHHRGAENYRRSGEVDAMRLPKDGWFAHQVMWDGWVDVERPRIHLLGHWNYAPGTVKDVQAVAGAEKAELFLNGRSLGFGKQTNRFLFTFPKVDWQPGTLKVVGYDAAGKTVCEDTRTTAGPPAALRLTPRTGPGGLRADGADLALVDVEVVDAAGNRCPTALNTVDFALTGPAEWRGGIAQGPDNYILSRSLPVEGGINRVSIRSASQAGTIALTATAPGLRSATAAITSHAVPAVDGLAPLRTRAEMPSFQTRGPTPRGESFAPLRRPLRIVGVKAGANGDRAALTFDDNEATSWSSDDNRANGWIHYDLAEPSLVSEVTLKMGRWRDRSYPLRITVDGKEVYSGSTPQSLGYVTIPVRPTMGKSVGIELIGSTVNRDAFGSIVEVENQANAATTGGPKNSKGSLTIVEAEIYSPVTRRTAARQR